MHIRNLEIKPRRDYYILDFELSFDKDNDEWSEWTKNWTTVYKQREQWYFNNIIYRYDKEKKDALFVAYQKKNVFKTPEPWLYYDLEKTNELINLLYKELISKEFPIKINAKFNLNNLFHKKNISKRAENLKKCMFFAYERNEEIGIIGRDAEYYIPLEAIESGFHLLNELPKGDLYDEQEDGIELLSNMDLACDNEYYFKRNSYIDYRVAKNGKVFDCEDVGYFAWELEEEILFFDELFFCDSMVKLAQEMIDEDEEGYYQGEIIEDEDDTFYYPLSGYDLFDLIICDNESVFAEEQFELILKKERFTKKIIKDFGIEFEKK